MAGKPIEPRPEDVAAGQTLRNLRNINGLSQKKLAAAIGVTFQQIQKYERGTNRISISTLTRICSALDVAPACFLQAPSGAPLPIITRKNLSLQDILNQLIIRRIARSVLEIPSANKTNQQAAV